MSIIKILDYFWHRLEWLKGDLRRYLMWVGVIVAAGVIIPYFSLEEFFERRKRKKGGAK